MIAVNARILRVMGGGRGFGAGGSGKSSGAGRNGFISARFSRECQGRGCGGAEGGQPRGNRHLHSRIAAAKAAPRDSRIVFGL